MRLIYRTLPTMKIIFTLIIATIINSAIAANFSEKQKTIIYNEAIKVLINYQNLTNRLSDDVINLNEVGKTSQSIIDLFVSRKSIIFNDLDPSHKLSEVYELETYMANLLLWYPEGMKIKLDFENLKAGNIISHENEIFTVDILTTKKIEGNYLNRQQNSNTEELLFRIAFFQRDKVFENYRIAGIRNSKGSSLSNDSKLLAEVKSVEFSEKDMELIKNQTYTLFQDYVNYLNLLTDPKEPVEDKDYYGLSLLGLFQDSTLKVANDIEPEPQDRWISINEYQQNLLSFYPDGVKNIGMNIDSAEYGKIIAQGDNRYYFNGYVVKFFAGKYMGKSVFRDNSKYDFKVSFERDENTFKNFQLTSIDKFETALYDQSKITPNQELPQSPISSLKRKGLFVGLAFGGGATGFSDNNLTSNPILNWTSAGKTSVNISGMATWYLNNKIGVSGGLSYSKFAVNMTLNGDFQNRVYETDINNEPFLRKITADYDSLVNLNYLSIPISVIFHSNKNPEKWGFYAEAGLTASFNINSTYKTTGNITSSGYYEQYPVTMQINTDPAFGFYSRQNINITGDANTSGFLLGLKTSFGISYPINYFTTVYCGPEIHWGLSNVSNLTENRDAFGVTSTAKNVGISSYGIKFGISYKL